jgi:branched-chain amino acid transport system substrate-binding protein
MGLLLSAALLWFWQERLRPVEVAVGVDEPVVNGGVIDPSDRNTADLYLEEHPRSRIRLVDHFNPADPARGPASITALKRRGVALFVNTQASSHAVPSLPQFADGRALAINVSAVSNALSGHNDFFLRIVPDLSGEQRAIAREIARLPGGRLLVLQDTGNRTYTDPAFRTFAAALGTDRWRIERRELPIARFNVNRDRHLLEGDYDALYILGGGFVPIIGILCQLFHSSHPNAPILLTPWARSPQVNGSAGPAAAHIRVVSPYPSRRQDPQVDAFLHRFERRFGYTPHAMALGTHQALELLDQALARGASSPEAVRSRLLSQPEHNTSFGPIRFDSFGDVQSRYHVFSLTDDAPPAVR